MGDSEGEEEIRKDFLVCNLTHKKQSKFCGESEEFSFGHVEQDTHVETSHSMMGVGRRKFGAMGVEALRGWWKPEGVISSRSL